MLLESVPGVATEIYACVTSLYSLAAITDQQEQGEASAEGRKAAAAANAYAAMKLRFFT